MLQLQKGETEGYHKEMEELRRQNANLAKEVERLTMQAEKPLEQPMSVSLTLRWWIVALLLYGDPQSEKRQEVKWTEIEVGYWSHKVDSYQYPLSVYCAPMLETVSLGCLLICLK